MLLPLQTELELTGASSTMDKDHERDLAVLVSLFVPLIPLETAPEAGVGSWVPLPPSN